MLQEWPVRSGKPSSPRPQPEERRMTTRAAAERAPVRRGSKEMKSEKKKI